MNLYISVVVVQFVVSYTGFVDTWQRQWCIFMTYILDFHPHPISLACLWRKKTPEPITVTHTHTVHTRPLDWLKETFECLSRFACKFSTVCRCVHCVRKTCRSSWTTKRLLALCLHAFFQSLSLSLFFHIFLFSIWQSAWWLKWRVPEPSVSCWLPINAVCL